MFGLAICATIVPISATKNEIFLFLTEITLFLTDLSFRFTEITASLFFSQPHLFTYIIASPNLHLIVLEKSENLVKISYCSKQIGELKRKFSEKCKTDFKHLR